VLERETRNCIENAVSVQAKHIYSRIVVAKPTWNKNAKEQLSNEPRTNRVRDV